MWNGVSVSEERKSFECLERENCKNRKREKKVGGGSLTGVMALGTVFPTLKKKQSRLSEINSLEASLLQGQLFKFAKTRLSEMELALSEIDPVFSKFCFSLA